MDNQFILRSAKMSDVDGLSQLCQKTFRETFVDDFSIPYPKKDLDSYLHLSTSPEVFSKKLNDPKQAIWVIEDSTSSELVAYVSAGPADTADFPHPDVCSNIDGAIHRLYVQRDRRNHGFGQQLMNAILSWFEEFYPTRPIWLAVLSKNFKAQKFYTHYGFSIAGEFNYLVGEWKEPNFIMKRQAANTS